MESIILFIFVLITEKTLYSYCFWECKRKMGDFEKHLKLAREKIDTVHVAHARGYVSVVGDQCVKVVEQLLDGDAFKNFKRHLTEHKEEFEYCSKHHPRIIRYFEMLFRLYSELGYEGEDGIKSRQAISLMKKVIDHFEEKWGIKIYGTER